MIIYQEKQQNYYQDAQFEYFCDQGIICKHFQIILKYCELFSNYINKHFFYRYQWKKTLQSTQLLFWHHAMFQNWESICLFHIQTYSIWREYTDFLIFRYIFISVYCRRKQNLNRVQIRLYYMTLFIFNSFHNCSKNAQNINSTYLGTYFIKYRPFLIHISKLLLTAKLWDFLRYLL